MNIQTDRHGLNIQTDRQTDRQTEFKYTEGNPKSAVKNI